MYIMNTYGPLYGASAIAANRFLSFLFGVAFPLFIIQSEFLLNPLYFALIFKFYVLLRVEFVSATLVFSRIETFLPQFVQRPVGEED